MLTHIIKFFRDIKVSKLPFIISSLFILFSILIFNRSVIDNGVDSGVYKSYTESMVDDLDYNILNNVKKENRWLVTSSNNIPDMHNPNFSIYLAPFYIYFKSVVHFLNLRSQNKYLRSWVSIANLFFSFLLIFGLNSFAKKNKVINILPILFGTPLFYYSFISGINSDIIQALHLTIIIIYIKKYINSWSSKEGITLAVLIGIGCALKVSFYFYFLPFGYLLIYKSSIKQVLRSILIIVSFILLTESFNYIRYDQVVLFSGYLTNINHNLSIFGFFLLLFGPIGYFIVSPLYLYLFSLFLFFLLRKASQITKFDVILLLFIVSICIKLVVFSFWIWGEDGLGARHLIVDTPIFFLMLTKILNHDLFRSRFIKLNALIVSLLTTVPMFFIVWLFKLDSENNFLLHNIEYPDFSTLNVTDFINFSSVYFAPHLNFDSLLQFIYILPLGILMYLVITKSSATHTNKLIAYFSIVFILFSTLNLFYNRANGLRHVKQGLTNTSVIGKGVAINLYPENISEIAGLFTYCNYHNNKTCISQIKIFLKQYSKEVKAQILSDPINFGNDLDKHIFHYSKIDEFEIITKLNKTIFQYDQ